MPKQDGQATVANRAPQCSQEVASEEAAAPHIGQLSVSAAMNGATIGRADFLASRFRRPNKVLEAGRRMNILGADEPGIRDMLPEPPREFPGRPMMAADPTCP